MDKVSLVFEQFVDAFYYILYIAYAASSYPTRAGWEKKNDGLGTEKSRASRAEIPDTRHLVFS